MLGKFIERLININRKLEFHFALQVSLDQEGEDVPDAIDMRDSNRKFSCELLTGTERFSEWFESAETRRDTDSSSDTVVSASTTD